MVAYRHGLRASELVALRWDDIDLAIARAGELVWSSRSNFHSCWRNVKSAERAPQELTTRRFPPPWSTGEGDNYFVVRDREGQQLAYVHFFICLVAS